MVFGERGSFDSFNPFILKGKAPYGVKVHTFETLLGRSYDEPFTLYGLLAESVETSENRDWVEFTLRKEARFSDNTPITIEDVIWSYETLGTEGHPRYVRSWGKVSKVEKTGERSVKFYSDSGDQELPLILGLRPILKKSDFDNRDFATASNRWDVSHTLPRQEPRGWQAPSKPQTQPAQLDDCEADPVSLKLTVTGFQVIGFLQSSSEVAYRA